MEETWHRLLVPCQARATLPRSRASACQHPGATVPEAAGPFPCTVPAVRVLDPTRPAFPAPGAQQDCSPGLQGPPYLAEGGVVAGHGVVGIGQILVASLPRALEAVAGELRRQHAPVSTASPGAWTALPTHAPLQDGLQSQAAPLIRLGLLACQAPPGSARPPRRAAAPGPGRDKELSSAGASLRGCLPSRSCWGPKTWH